MNLQVTVPYQKCVYSCEMCVARSHKNQGTFENLYKTNKKEWYRKFEKLLLNNDYSSIVLTGECDPTQDMRYCDDVISLIRTTKIEMPTIEFTTHNQKAIRSLYDSSYGRKVDVVTLSVTNVREYLNAWRFPERNAFFSPTYRMVILLTEEFEFLNVNNFNTMGFDQITFKTLQHGEDVDVNKWIDANKMSEEGLDEIRKIVDKYNSHETCSVRLDTSCQDATNRYHIFRSDGKLYDSWEAIYSMEDYAELKRELVQPEVEVANVYDKAGFPIKTISFSKITDDKVLEAVLSSRVKVVDPVVSDNNLEVIRDCAEKEKTYSTNNATVKLDDISYPPERFVYKDIPAPIIKEIKETDYD